MILPGRNRPAGLVSTDFPKSLGFSLNLLPEHPKFPHLISLLARHRDDTMRAGVSVMNQNLSFPSSLLFGPTFRKKSLKQTARSKGALCFRLPLPSQRYDTPDFSILPFPLRQFLPHALDQLTQELSVIHIIYQDHLFRPIIRKLHWRIRHQLHRRRNRLNQKSVIIYAAKHPAVHKTRNLRTPPACSNCCSKSNLC